MIPITSVMTKDVVCVKPDTPVYEAMRILIDRQISGMPVVDDNMEVCGILSEKDVLGILIDANSRVNDIVEQYMSSNVVTFQETASAIDICKFFINNHIRRVPIVKDNKLVGIVSRRDIMDLIVEARSKISEHRFN